MHPFKAPDYKSELKRLDLYKTFGVTPEMLAQWNREYDAEYAKWKDTHGC